MPIGAKLFIAMVNVLGLGSAALAFTKISEVESVERAIWYVALSMVASLVKMRLPGLSGTYSLNGVVLLAGVVYLELPVVVAAGVAGVTVQTFWRAKERPSAVQYVFNVANEAFSLTLAWSAIAYCVSQGIWAYRPALLAAAAALYFVLNTSLVSAVLSMLGQTSFGEVSRQWYAWSYPFYLLGAAAVGLLPVGGNKVDVQAWAILVPLAYITHFFSSLSGRQPEPDGEGNKAAIPAGAKAFTGVLAAAACSLMLVGAAQMGRVDWLWFGGLLALAVVTATWKVKLPGVAGTISAHYVIVLVAIAETSLFEALVLAAVGPLVQCLWRPKSKPQAVQVVFNASVTTVSAGAVFCMLRMVLEQMAGDSMIPFMAMATSMQFVVNTLLISTVLSLVDGEKVVSIWRRVYFWTFPLYMVGGAAAAVMVGAHRGIGLGPALMILPLLGLIQLSYRFHVNSKRLPDVAAEAGRSQV